MTPVIEHRADRFRWPIVVAAAVVGLLQVLGALQVRQQVYRGYRTDDSRQVTGLVTEVIRDSPADRAGLRVGDRIVRIGGMAADDRRALDARPRPRIGDTLTLAVDRGGRGAELRMTLAGLPPLGVVAYLASGLTGLSFLAFGLWAYLTLPRKATFLLALAGIGIAAIFTEMPYVASPLVRAVQESGLIATGLFGFAALLHFMLVFPREMRILARRATVFAIYAPAAVVSATQVAATIYMGSGSGGPATLTTTLALVLLLLYFCLTIAALINGYATATRRERSAWGLNALVVCILLGLAPMIPTAIALVAPRIVLPLSEYYDLAWVVIPFALARATLKQASTGRPATAQP